MKNDTSPSRQQAIEACNHLTDYFERQQDWNQAKHYAKQQLELEPWSEVARGSLTPKMPCSAH